MGVAAVHYFYMREYWVIIHNSPILYRYIDWSITVPLQMIEFYLILSAVKPDIDSGMFWRLMIGTVLMLAFGYGGEAHLLGPVGAWVGFICGLCGWAYLEGDLQRRSRHNCCKRCGKQACRKLFQDHALHRHRGLVHLPSWLLLRLLDGECCSPSSQFDL